MSGPTLTCLCSDILPLMNQVLCLPLLLEVAQRGARICLCYFMATTTLHPLSRGGETFWVSSWFLQGCSSGIKLGVTFTQFVQLQWRGTWYHKSCETRGSCEVLFPCRAVSGVCVGFNSPGCCLWWTGKILRYQVAPPRPASSNALCVLKMHDSPNQH